MNPELSYDLWCADFGAKAATTSSVNGSSVINFDIPSHQWSVQNGHSCAVPVLVETNCCGHPMWNKVTPWSVPIHQGPPLMQRICQREWANINGGTSNWCVSPMSKSWMVGDTAIHGPGVTMFVVVDLNSYDYSCYVYYVYNVPITKYCAIPFMILLTHDSWS